MFIGVNHWAFVNQSSLLFDGVDEFVDIGSAADIQFNGSSAFSISAWIQIDVGAGQNLYAIATNVDPPAAATGIFLGAVPGAGPGTLSFEIIADANAGDEMGFTSTGGPAAAVWNHVVATYDGVNRAGMSLYLNGVALAGATSGAATLSGSSATANAWELAGPANHPTALHFDGNLDEVSFHDEELTAAQVTALFNTGRPLYVPSYASTLHYYRMGDRAVFPTVPDMISGLDGTMTNMEAGDVVQDVPE